MEIDTAHFKGNFPESCELHALASEELNPSDVSEDQWTRILPHTKLGPHRQHYFQLEAVDEEVFTHVRVTIFPDGGIKRVRIIGRRAGSGSTAPSPSNAAGDPTPTVPQETDVAFDTASPAAETEQSNTKPIGPVIPALPLTPEAFAPFGQVVQAYDDLNAVPSPRTTHITGANQGTAVKFHKLALLESSYPTVAGATTGLSVYRCKPIDVASTRLWEIKLLERHPCTNQAFIPMGGGEGIDNPEQTYLVIVALNGPGDAPDLQSLRAFIATAGQGIVYHTGIWRKFCSWRLSDMALTSPLVQTIQWPSLTEYVVFQFIIASTDTRM